MEIGTWEYVLSSVEEESYVERGARPVYLLILGLHRTPAIVQVEEDPDIRVTLGKMEPLSNVFLARNQALAAEEEDFVGGGPRQTKSGQVRTTGE